MVTLLSAITSRDSSAIRYYKEVSFIYTVYKPPTQRKETRGGEIVRGTGQSLSQGYDRLLNKDMKPLLLGYYKHL